MSDENPAARSTGDEISVGGSVLRFEEVVST